MRVIPIIMSKATIPILESWLLTIILQALRGPSFTVRPPEQRLGPALQVASPNLNRFELVSSVHPSSFPEPGSLVSKNRLWLEALFKRIRAFSLPNDLARHLFLSILHI
jgi:hypothetical protein